MRTRINSIIFVSICAVLVFTATGCIVLYGLLMYKNGFIGASIASMIIAVIILVGGLLLTHDAEHRIFNEIINSCGACSTKFKEKEMEKQIEHSSIIGVHMSYKCPHCKALLN